MSVCVNVCVKVCACMDVEWVWVVHGWRNWKKVGDSGSTLQGVGGGVGGEGDRSGGGEERGGGKGKGQGALGEESGERR